MLWCEVIHATYVSTVYNTFSHATIQRLTYFLLIVFLRLVS